MSEQINSGTNRRHLTRYLCGENFSDSTVKTAAGCRTVTSVNFNHCGIALFSQQPLPDVSHFYISFCLSTDEADIRVDELFCELRYSRDSDIGFQYGVRFLPPADEESELLSRLLRIEAYLAQHVDEEDRYGLF